MPGTVITLLADASAQYTWLSALASEFGWTVQHVATLDQLRDFADSTVAVLFDPARLLLRPQEALKLVLASAPRALPILCQTFSEMASWPELAAAGAFHVLPLPLHANEVRQSLGFVWAAQPANRIAAAPRRHQLPKRILQRHAAPSASPLQRRVHTAAGD